MFLYQNVILSLNIKQTWLDMFMKISKLNSQKKNKNKLFNLAR